MGGAILQRAQCMRNRLASWLKSAPEKISSCPGKHVPGV